MTIQIYKMATNEKIFMINKFCWLWNILATYFRASASMDYVSDNMRDVSNNKANK